MHIIYEARIQIKLHITQQLLQNTRFLNFWILVQKHCKRRTLCAHVNFYKHLLRWEKVHLWIQQKNLLKANSDGVHFPQVIKSQ